MGMTFPKAADVVTGCSVRPEVILPEVYGQHRSEVRRDGNRHWWFDRPEGAAQFRKEFKSRLVKIIEGS